MMAKSADLHIHSYFSDGTLSPSQIIEQARQNGLHCLALTDHDTIEGIAPLMEEAAKFDIEIISGIEISSAIQGRDVHILGYLFDTKNPPFLSSLSVIQNLRNQRMEQMVTKLHQLAMTNITLQEVYEISGEGSVGRPHLALLLKKKGWVKDIQEAFDRFLAEGGPAYVETLRISVQEAISFIKQAGGVAVLAHPMITKIDEMIPQFVQWGLGGIEAYYSQSSSTITQFYKNLAKKYGLVVTGGSDAHGDIKKSTFIGKIKLPYAYVEALKEKARS